MAYNGSGTFVRLYNFVNDRDASIPIDSTRMDAELDGMATALSNCVTADGQTTTTAVIPFAAGINVFDGAVDGLAVKFTSDTDSGFYRIGANNWALVAQAVPVLELNGAASSAATGITITSAAAASGVNIAARSSGTDENLTINAKGAGTVTLNPTGTGEVASARNFRPSSNDGASLGVTGTRWSDAYLAPGAVLSFGSGSEAAEFTHTGGGVVLGFSGTMTFSSTSTLNANKLNFGTATELTIASGAVTVTRSYHTIDTESDAASDDLDTINGGSEGDILILRAANDARTVVIKNGTGNIRGAGAADRSLTHTQDNAWYMYVDSVWVEMNFRDVTA